MQTDRLHPILTNLPVPVIRAFDKIGSTNDEALAWAEAGAPDGSLVVADQQTKGRGRLGRAWVTNPGAALAFSLILRPTVAEQENLGLFSPLAGLAVCLALQGLGLAAEIKWPNDVLLARRKTCGILAESSWQAGQVHGVVVGIGINIAPASVPPSDQVQFPATCVEGQLGRQLDRWVLLHAVLKSFFEWRSRLGTTEFLRAWEQRLAFKGEQVTLKNSGGQSFNGLLLGVNDQGNLRLRMDDGMEKMVSVGDVHLRPVRG